MSTAHDFADYAGDQPADDVDPLAVYLAEMSRMQHTINSLQAEVWRLISEKVARGAPPQIWLTLKAAAGDVGEAYENVRKWCELGVIVAEKRGSRWFIQIDYLRAHIKAVRGR